MKYFKIFIIKFNVALFYLQNKQEKDNLKKFIYLQYIFFNILKIFEIYRNIYPLFYWCEDTTYIGSDQVNNNGSSSSLFLLYLTSKLGSHYIRHLDHIENLSSDDKTLILLFLGSSIIITIYYLYNNNYENENEIKNVDLDNFIDN